MRQMKATPSAPIGYLKVVLAHGRARRKNCFVHRLVLEAFHGPAPEGLEACHKNGNATDNRASNLRWDTRRANLHDRARHGTDNAGERHGQARLTEAQAREAKTLHARGNRIAAIARAYDVSQGAIRALVTGRSWKHL